MAAGLGFKTFTTGEVLTAGDVNGYLMQGINVFASEAARNAAITSPQEGQFAFTKDTNSLWYYTGSAWAASGATGDIEGVTAGVGISGGGTSGTVTVTNSMATAIDAKGDLVPGTGADTFSRLAVGANGTVLTADSAEATGLKWAATAASGMTLIKRATFTSVTNTGTTFDGVFTSTYKAYKIIVETITNGTASAVLQFQYRVSGATANSGFYRGGYFGFNESGSISPNFGNDTTVASLVPNTGNVGPAVSGEMTINRVANGSITPQFVGAFYGSSQYSTLFVGNVYRDPIVADGFMFSESTGNISGTVAVYGLATS